MRELEQLYRLGLALREVRFVGPDAVREEPRPPAGESGGTAAEQRP